MIHLRIYGGLGNQIFQLAAALFLAQKWGKSKISIDDISLQYDTLRNNELCKIFDFDKLQKSNIAIIWERNNIYYNKFYRLFHLLLERGIEYERKFLQGKGPTHIFAKLIFRYLINDINYPDALKNGIAHKARMDGYFQECWSQRDIEQIFQFLQTIYKKNVNVQLDENECAIHIRGTDYLKYKFHNLLGQEYYQKAAKHMVEEYGVERFVVVTDDLEHAKDILQTFPYPYRFYSQGLKCDFDLISNARKKILGNSTFSLIACLLGSKDQVVIAPIQITVNSKRVFKLPGEVKMNFQK